MLKQLSALPGVQDPASTAAFVDMAMIATARLVVIQVRILSPPSTDDVPRASFLHCGARVYDNPFYISARVCTLSFQPENIWVNAEFAFLEPHRQIINNIDLWHRVCAERYSLNDAQSVVQNVRVSAEYNPVAVPHERKLWPGLLRLRMLEDEELDTVALESTRTIDIDCFVPADSIGWIWYDKPHHLVPGDKIGEEAFSVIREAMVKSNTRAISRVVLYHRERAVLLEPRDKGMVLWTLRYGDEVRDETEYFKGIKGKPDPKQKKQLASHRRAHATLVAVTGD